MRVILAAIGLTSLVLPSAAPAQPDSETFSISIPYRDLNLYNEAGLATLKGRVKTQSALACGSVEPSPLREAAQIKQCREQFMRAAEQQLKLSFLPVGGSVQTGF